MKPLQITADLNTKKLTSIAVWLLLTCIILPAWPQAKFDNSIVERGLPIRQVGGVTAIVQDHYSFIWIAGENGLARYDGVNLHTYQATEGRPSPLPSDYVWDLALDSQGDLWIATSGGLCIYRQHSGVFERIESIGGKRLVSEVAISLLFHDNFIYVGTTVGLDIIDVINNSVKSYIPNAPESVATGSNIVYDISIDKDGNVWIATELSGVARLDQESGTFHHFYSEPNNPYSISSNHVRKLYHDSKGRMWVGTAGSGLNVFEPATNNFKRIVYPSWIGNSTQSVIGGILEDEKGYFWISVDQHGLLKFDSAMNFVEHFSHSSGDRYSLQSNKTRVVFMDQNRDLWIGMFPFGVSFLDRSNEAIQSYRSDQNNPNSLTNDAILSLKQDKHGIIWVGTEIGLNSLDPATKKINRYLSDASNPNSLAANAVLNLEVGIENDLWVGTWSGGLHRFDTNTGLFYRYSPDNLNKNSIGDTFVWALHKDRHNTIWVGTEKGGLQYYRPATNDFGRYIHDPKDPLSISTNYVRDITEDNEGRLWIASPLGISIFDIKTARFTTIKSKNGERLNDRHIFCIFKDSRGFIWAGGDKGVIRIDPVSNEIKIFNMKDGLPSKTVASIREDKDGYIWLATYNGLARLHPQTFSITSINVANGLIGKSYNRDASLLDRDGNLYFGSTEGLTVFKPDDVKPRSSRHPIVVTNFKVFNNDVVSENIDPSHGKSVFSNKSISLSHTQNIFSLDFVMLNFRNSALNKYAYKLEGFMDDWNYVGASTTATYTNMSPGRYVFRVKGKAPGEDWTDMENPVVINIASPLWQRWWAYLIYIALGGILAYTVHTLQQLKKSSRAYKRLSLTDALSGAYNRAGIAQIVEGLFINREMKGHVCLLLIDIDHFKRINDERGHNEGDHVIKVMAKIARSVIREGDSFGRWGGEEFIVLCPRSNPTGATLLAEKIRKAVEGHQFGVESNPLRITVSIGIALVQADETFEEVLERADKALYEAKNTGRNRAVLAPSDEAIQ